MTTTARTLEEDTDDNNYYTSASSLTQNMVKIAVGQCCAKANILHNLAVVEGLVKTAAASDAKALFLPEASDYIASSTAESLSLVSTEDNKRFVEAVARMSRVYNIAINIGIHEPTAVEKTLRNTSLWLQDGQIKQRYRKLHLFDVDIKDGPVLKESENVEKGQEIVPPFDTLVGKVGLTICFDLRFPETGLALRRQGAQILTYPSAFTVPTGQAHWEVLLRARAIETQSYVVAAAQIGKHNEKRVSYGHSMIIDPWGKIVAHIEEEDEYPRVAFADVDLGLVEKVRREVPLLRRTDIYPEI